MAKRFVEIPSSGKVSVAMPGEERTWTQTYLFQSTDEMTVHEVFADALVPNPGDRNLAKPAYVCRTVDVQPVPQSKYAWHVNVKWSTRHVLDNPDEEDATTRQWFRITRQSSVRTAGIYRDGSAIWSATNLNSNGNVTWPPTADIGGTKVDANGQPKQKRIAQQTIDVSILWDRSLDVGGDMSGNGVDFYPDPDQGFWDEYIGTRNEEAFLGWGIGMVTYVGTTMNQAPDEWVVITHKFIADEWQHLEQRAVPNAAGQVILLPGATWIGNQVRQAETVAWYQPYNELKDFADLFDWRPGLMESIDLGFPSW